MLEGGRRVKLTDFGTAVHIDEIAGSMSKLTGVTPHFTAPEVRCVYNHESLEPQAFWCALRI